MSNRELPLHPDLDQLKTQAKELLRDFRADHPEACASFSADGLVDASAARLSDAQRILARAYGASSWPRLVACCRVVDAIWRDDQAALQALIAAQPALISEDALVRPAGRRSHWGPPMSFAANLGRLAMIDMLHVAGARDHLQALDRAILQGQVDAARRLHELAGKPAPSDDLLGGAAYTLNLAGTKFALELGARVIDGSGRLLAPVATVLETDSRKPAAKHAILEAYVRAGAPLPDTPCMALHRGRIDLLEDHLARDAGLLNRQFAHADIYPPELGCGDAVMATHGTPLDDATLLHMAIDFDETPIAQWLLDKGASADHPAAIDADGFGGHTPLFSAIVSQPHFWPNHAGRPASDAFARLLLDHGASVNPRASLRKQMHPGYMEDHLREYRDVTPLGWGRRFHFSKLVSRPALDLIASRGGIE